MSFSGWSCWSNAGNVSEFRFSQWSGINMIYGITTNTNNQQLEGVLNIPAFQNLGIYNLEVYECSGSGWVMFPNSFQINSPSWNCVGGACIDPGDGQGTYSSLSNCQSNCVLSTWDCVGGACVDPGTGQGTFASLSACQSNCVLPTFDCVGGACIDPGTGQGIFASLTACQANCVITPSWDCVGGACVDPGTGQGAFASLSACQSNCVLPTWDCVSGSCIDPGTGQGTFASLSACQSNCVLSTWDCISGSCVDPGTGQGTFASLIACQDNCNNSSVELFDLNNLKIYPNPTINIFNISFTSKTVQDIDIKISDFLGKVIYEDINKNFVGDYLNKLNLSDYVKGIYFINIETNEGITNKKLILH
jgi:hypothetical protein